MFSSDYRTATLGVFSGVAVVAYMSNGIAVVIPGAVLDLDGSRMYGLAFSSLYTTSLFGMVLAGYLCDGIGSRVAVLAGSASLGLGLVLSGTAWTMATFLIGRIATGLGVGLILVSMYYVIATFYPDLLRPKMFGLVSSAWMVPALVGPSLGGLTADLLGWRVVFLGALPVALLPLVLVWSPSTQWRRIPLKSGAGPAVKFGVGAAMGLGVVQYAVNYDTRLAMPLLVIGAMLLTLCLPRLLPMGFFRLEGKVARLVGVRGMLGGAFIGAQAFIPLMLTTVSGLSLTHAGFAISGSAVGWALGSWFQGRDRLPVSRGWLVRCGCFFVAMGAFAMTLLALGLLPLWLGLTCWALGGIGMGLASSTIYVLFFQSVGASAKGSGAASMQISDALFTIVTVSVGTVLTRVWSGTEVVFGWAATGATFAAVFLFAAILSGVALKASGRIASFS